MTLSWVRSRHTQELVGGTWRTMAGVNDLTRNQRQQELLLEALSRLKSFRSVTEFSALVEDLTDAFSIDDGLSLSEAIGLAWDMRGIDIGSIQRPTIPVTNYVTEGGRLRAAPPGLVRRGAGVRLPRRRRPGREWLRPGGSPAGAGATTKGRRPVSSLLHEHGG